ncbi:hypothetical protein F4778DRAFT_761735 [Xylariomycetidae sp. FL2044]|nr:hypothetical protein F4778DRAFT_761735 [Xylariomycetidae sp. FL2044]
MSRHQAYRNYDYENDLDEYEGAGYSDEENELSPEDRAQMTAGTAEIRAALGTESSKVTTQQIEEALWHYYYDIDKSITYLMNKFVAPPTPKASKNQKENGDGSPDIQHPQHASSAGFFHDNQPLQHSSLVDFFHDMPWGNIPQHRVATFTEPTMRPGGLLGGSSAPSGKMSKLQALAAARKKKADDQKSSRKSEQGELKEITQKIDRLPLGEKTKPLQENLRPSTMPDAAKPDVKSSPKASGLPILDSMHNNSTKEMSISDRLPIAEDTGIKHRTFLRTARSPAAPEPAAPSAFAQALLGPVTSSVASATTLRNQYPFPYMSYTESVVDAFSGPSPDDIVLAAQSKASNKKTAANANKKKGNSGDGRDEATDGMKNLKVDDAPLPKSKNLDVLREFERSQSKKSASFVVVGHVDAGKSTLMGRLLLDLDVVDQRTIQKYRKEAESIGKSSFALAWVLDQRSEERSRGVTIDIATNKFETANTSFTILDAPGHRDFIPNMIAGASQADFAILVVDATTGAFEAGLKGQTREHSLLLRSMGVSRIIVAVNKLDTVGWSQDRFDEISQQVSGFLSGTGFQLKNVSFVPVSGLHGDNMVKRSTDTAASWYEGRTLIEELESSEPTNRALEKPLRMTISEIFRTAQSPVTIAGRLDAGSLQAGDALLVQPSGEKAYVKSLELDSEPVDWAVAGQNVVIHLSNIDPIHVKIGDIICDTKQPIVSIDTFTLKALAFDILMPMQVDVHRGRLHAAGQIVEIPALLDKVKGTVSKKKPKIVKPASVARIVVKLGTKVPLEAGQRIVLRTGGETVAAGLLE